MKIKNLIIVVVVCYIMMNSSVSLVNIKDTSFYASVPTNTENMASIENETRNNQNSDASMSITANQYTTSKMVALITALDSSGEWPCEKVAGYFTQIGTETYYETWRDITKQKLLDYLDNKFDNAIVQPQEEKALVADFTYKPTSPIVGEAVYFFDESKGEDIVFWQWTFNKIDENGYAVSIENNFIVSWTLFTQNPIVTFHSSGYYSVTLTVRNESGEQDTCCKVIYVCNSTTEVYALTTIDVVIFPVEPTSNNTQISPLNCQTKTLAYWISVGHANTKNFDGAPCYGLLAPIKYQPSDYYEILNYTDIYGREGITGSVIFINSCNSYKNPWKSALVSNNPAYYIGGNKLLNIYKSNRVTVAFWHDYLINGTDVETALNKAVQTYFPEEERREDVYGLWPIDG